MIIRHLILRKATVVTYLRAEIDEMGVLKYINILDFTILYFIFYFTFNISYIKYNRASKGICCSLFVWNDLRK